MQLYDSVPFTSSGDMGFDDRNIIQDANMDDTLYKNTDATNILLDDSLEKNQDVEKPLDIDFDPAATDGNFGKNDFDDFGMCVICMVSFQLGTSGKSDEISGRKFLS